MTSSKDACQHCGTTEPALTEFELPESGARTILCPACEKWNREKGYLGEDARVVA